MRTLNRIEELQACIAGERAQGRTVGFVPTMGALHDGHISLVNRCVRDNDICVTSIFVNPTQFNDPHDLDTYPRTPERDQQLLLTTGCRYVFAPTEHEMRSLPARTFDLGPVAEGMEGACRPGHFAAVAQVVAQLFDIVQPDKAYFGEKDFQQLAVIRTMTRQLSHSVRIIPCPIVREPDGLAMSSRNLRLSPHERQQAPLIAQTLRQSAALTPRRTVEDTRAFVVNTINSNSLLRVEYFEIVRADTLQPINRWTDANNANNAPRGCIAVRCGNVRLIDNISYPC